MDAPWCGDQPQRPDPRPWHYDVGKSHTRGSGTYSEKKFVDLFTYFIYFVVTFIRHTFKKSLESRKGPEILIVPLKY